MKLGNNLKKYRKIKGINQSELGNLVGVQQGTIANYENGNRTPTIEMLILLVKVLNVSIDELLGTQKTVIQKNDIINIDKEEIIEKVVMYLILKDEYRIIEILKSYYEQTKDILQVFTDIVTPAMYRIGILWEQGDISIADEHAAAEIMNRMVDWFTVQEIKSEHDGQCAICMAVSPEQHTLGVKMVASYMDFSGFRSIYIGNNLPTKELIEIIRKEKPKVLVFSVTLNSHQDSLINMIKVIRHIEIFSDIDILVGGQGLDGIKFNEFKRVYRIKNIAELGLWIKKNK